MLNYFQIKIRLYRTFEVTKPDYNASVSKTVVQDILILILSTYPSTFLNSFLFLPVPFSDSCYSYNFMIALLYKK